VAATDAAARREELVAFWRELSDCRKCPLAETRNTVVFGTGSSDADLMFVGEAPGFHEDKQGKPFVGQAGKLLDKLLAEIGMDREQCFIANVLKCRPPGNRDPQPLEIDACKGHLHRQVELIEPRVVCTLGNFATKLLSGRPEGITKVRGAPQVRELGGRTVFLYPIFHPAAALYTPAMLEQLRADFGELPRLLAEEQPQPEGAAEAARPRRFERPAEAAGPPRFERPADAADPRPEETPDLVATGASTGDVEPDQLGLF
jgi:DNA polymerase